MKPRQVWAIRFFLDQHRRTRDRALFDLATDCKLRGCDVVKFKIGDIVLAGQIRTRAIVVQATVLPEVAASNLRSGTECELQAQSHQVFLTRQTGAFEISVMGASLGDYSELKVLVRPTVGGAEIQVTSSIVSKPLMTKLANNAEHNYMWSI